MKKKIIILLFVVMICLVVSEIYAKYTSQINVNVTTTSGNLICDAIVDNPGTYTTSSGVPYFKVTVRNHSNNVITSVPIQYKLKISNDTGATGIYKFGTADTGTFEDTIETTTYSFGNTTQQQQIFDVQVITTSLTNQSIGFKVDLDCSQVFE